ncbi:hypothetical protein CK203_034669 [Vitis vinifera]|uniref:Reverse transcriptase domain-containing protein n=1 Tax=Vitis vinifera TaxID=29760 RepID=A0A438HWB6_VITVI|nr:hypothetical protein CK203_034669 [Vitis vinifera]
MDLPPSFDEERSNGKVCKLKKSLYGLNSHYGPGLIDLLKQSNNRDTNRLILIILYSIDVRIVRLESFIVNVDDIILTGDDKAEMERLKESSRIQNKRLGKFKVFPWDGGYCGISKALLGEDYSLKELKKEVLKPSLMPIGLVQLKIEGLPPAIAHLFRELGYMEEQEANSCLL